MSYDLPDYDGWKTATPWDNEQEIEISFECRECLVESDGVALVVNGYGDYDVECPECNATNNYSHERDYDLE
jgi:rubredoxin